MLHIIIYITRAQTIMKDTSYNSFFPQKMYACETARGTEMTVPLQQGDNSELDSFICFGVLVAKNQSNSYRERWKLPQLTVSMLMRKDYQCKLSFGHISRTRKLNLLNVPKIKWQIRHRHHTFKCMTIAFVFPVENHTLSWNTCKYTSHITEPFFAHENVPIQSFAGINEKF